jgi:hypothetical protein
VALSQRRRRKRRKKRRKTRNQARNLRKKAKKGEVGQGAVQALHAAEALLVLQAVHLQVALLVAQTVELPSRKIRRQELKKIIRLRESQLQSLLKELLKGRLGHYHQSKFSWFSIV